MGLLVPARRRGVEILDDPSVPADARDRSLRDVARSNVLFGGRRAALVALARAVCDAATAKRAGGDATPVTLLDVGTGAADIPRAAKRDATRNDIALRTIGVDSSPSLLASARSRLDDRVAGDGLALPLADRSIDVVLASQIAHHFAEPEAIAFARELTRVARYRVVIADLRRSWLAAGLFWLASWPLAFHPITRHDGVVSVLRGFTPADLERLVHAADGSASRVERRLGFRLTASWAPPSAVR